MNVASAAHNVASSTAINVANSAIYVASIAVNIAVQHFTGRRLAVQQRTSPVLQLTSPAHCDYRCKYSTAINVAIAAIEITTSTAIDVASPVCAVIDVGSATIGVASTAGEINRQC